MDNETKALWVKKTIEAYGTRLYYNAAINFIINSLAAFLVLKYSTKAMGWYKYYILMTIISAFIMDFHSCFIYGFFIILPTTISCPTGLTKNLGWYWGSHANFVMMHINLGICGLSLFHSFVYQYITLTKDSEIFKRPKTIAAMFASMILYPMPAIILYAINIDYEGGKEFALKNYPYLAEIYVSNSCNNLPITAKLYAYLVDAIIQIGAIYVFAVIVALKIHAKLKAIKNSMSIATMKARRQFLIALLIQGTVPLIFIVIPVIAILALVIFGKANLEDVSQYIFQFFGIHSCGNALAVMLIIKPYRQALILWTQPIRAILFKKTFTKPTHSLRVSVSGTSGQIQTNKFC